MRFDRQKPLSEKDIHKIHAASMEILGRGGLVFHHNEARRLFKAHGFKTSGHTVFITENNVARALETAPGRFCLEGLNPDRFQWIGGDDLVFAPTYGPPFVIEADGRQRPGGKADYELAVKLNHTSEVAGVTGFKYLAPADLRATDAYLDMLLASLTMSDKPLMGSTDDEQAARDTIDILKLVYGPGISGRHLALGLINPLSPLAFAGDMAGALMAYAAECQPLIILNMILAGSSGPIQLPGLLALMNAEILGGLVLAQLAGPGTPVIYGTTSCPVYMKTGAAAVGNPETLKISAAAMQLARYYQLPCRTGGSLTDSLTPDAQALAEGALSLVNAVRGGANFILHALGMIGGYLGISFEKWILDEEVCRYALALLKPLEVNRETLGVESVITVGSGGSYLARPETVKLCRAAFLNPRIFNKLDSDAWRKAGATELITRAQEEIKRRQETYTAPDIGASLKNDLAAFIEKRRRN